ncbi:MAG: ABC transporter ATP-binding protein [Candidatus Nanopelagicaceae bacterium]|nr:ABC transporter ATP-binding protein [Candidatus Nanopelagicaceae bacterium]
MQAMSPTPFDHLPVPDPGQPDMRTVPKFLWWIGKKQKKIVLTGTFFGIVNLLCVALMPGVLGRGIQAIADEANDQLRIAVISALALGSLQAAAGILRHRRAVGSWISAATRLQQLVARKAVDLGADLPRLVSTGEVSAINSNDVERVARVYDLIPRLSGAIVSFFVVSVLLINSSPTLGLMVIIGVPLLGLAIGPIIKPLQNRESAQREKLSESSALAADTVAGLRILRGIGGEETFLNRFRIASQNVRAAAVRTAKMRALLDGLQVILPGSLVVGVIYVGGNLVSRGELKVGELLAFYGYSAFLMIPLQILTESAQRLTSGTVAARRVMKLLSVERVQSYGALEFPQNFKVIKDLKSGLEIRSNTFLGVVCDNSLIADELVDRLGGYLDADQVVVDDRSFETISRDDLRRNIYAQEKEPAILSGTVESLFQVSNSGRVHMSDAIESASAIDILDSLEGDGYSAEVVERGRTLSGGQRQRLALARTLFVDAPILILDDPTSAVDAHTEARIAQRLKNTRVGKTTVVFTNSPLLLDHTDQVALVVDGKVITVGNHFDLLKQNDDYRRLVVRGE